MKNQNQSDKPTVKPQSLSPEQEAAWEGIQDRYSDLTDKYLALKSEHAALVAVAEAAELLVLKSDAIGRDACWQNVKSAIAALAAVQWKGDK